MSNYIVKTYDGSQIILPQETVKNMAEVAGLMQAVDAYGDIHYINPTNLASASPDLIPVSVQDAIRADKNKLLESNSPENTNAIIKRREQRWRETGRWRS